jgi:hydroxypyruvate reductase
MALPADGLTLEDKVAVNALLLSRGVPIAQMNAVRKHLSRIKGGWLAAHAHACITLAISDVIGAAEDDPSVIGSGPGVADTSTFADATAVLQEFALWDDVPPRVRDRFIAGSQGRIPETPKPADPRLARSSVFVVGSRRDGMEGARREAERLGYRAVVLGDPVLGEARERGPEVVARAVAFGATGDRVCVISSGETTVHVRGGGRGGRNQELALSALPVLAASSWPTVLISVGTDGVDGPTDAAGAIADRDSLARAASADGPTVEAALAGNDSYSFFSRLGDLVRIGPTGTNVGDLQIFLRSG